MSDLAAALDSDSTEPRRGWWAWWPVLVVLLLSAVVRVPLLAVEVGRNDEGTGSLYGIAARNYLRLDTSGVLFAPVLNVAPPVSPAPPTAGFTVYAHHPPTVPLLIAAAFAVFGVGDWQMRLVPTLFALASVAVTYGLLLRRAGPVAATVGAAAMAFVPMSLRFGQMPDVINAQLVFACLVWVWAYLRVVEAAGASREQVAASWGEVSPGRLGAGPVALMLVAMLHALLTDWPAFFLLPVMAAHLLLARPHGWARLGGLLAGVSVVTFAGLYVWVSLASGDWQLIVRQFLNRTTQGSTDDEVPFTAATWFAGVWRYHLDLHTLPLLIAAGVGAATALFCRPHRGPLVLVALLWGWAAVHGLVGRQGVLNHAWWWWPATPALCVSAGVLAGVIADYSRRGGGVALLMTAAVCAGWTITELRHQRSPAWTRGGITAYSVRELGETIRRYTPPGASAAFFDDEPQPYLFWYADRPVHARIWTRDDLDRVRAVPAPPAYLFYSFVQPAPGPVATYIFPKIYEPHGGEILPYLREHHTPQDAGPFWVFDLTTRR